jgi:hypothetical protein
MADYLTGHDGILTVAPAPGTPPVPGTYITLELMEFTYRETEDVAKGGAAAHYGTGRTRLGTDWQLNVRAKLFASAAPLIFRRGAITAFIAKTDAAGSPAITIAGIGISTESELPVPEGDYIIYTLRIESYSPASADLPTLTYA